MSWYNEKGRDTDVVLSSRVRFARNIKDYPFSPLLDETGASEIISKVKDALSNFNIIDMRSKGQLERSSYVEKHLISPNFAASAAPGALLIDDKEINAVMVCEEDHIRIQSILPGLALREAFDAACVIDDKIDSCVTYAYDEKLGYLTHCPTNLGTGMRASVMMFLPALTMTNLLNRYASQLEKLGMTLRGMYGEGSNSEAYVYQLSNSITMGITEDETISKLENIINQLIESERNTREKLKAQNYDRICDKVCRSMGILKSAHMMSSKEFLKLFADIKLGNSLGMLEEVDDTSLSKLFIAAMPATLVLSDGGDITSDTERDKLRAKFIKAYNFRNK